MPQADTEVSALHRVISASVSAIITSLFATPLDNTKIRMQVQGSGICGDFSSCVYCYPNNIDLTRYVSKQRQKENISNKSIPKNLDIHINVNVSQHANHKHTNVSSTSTKINVANGHFYEFHNGLMEHRLPAWKLEEEILHSRCRNMPFKHSLDAFYQILRFEGVAHLYSGLAVTLWMAAPAIVLYYNTYDALRNYILNNAAFVDRYELHNYVPGVCGCVGRMFAVSVIAPLELIRTQMMAKTINHDLTVFEAIRLNIRSGGLFSLWKGLIPSLWRDVPFSGVFWTSYELWKDYFRKRNIHRNMNTNANTNINNDSMSSLHGNSNVDQTFGIAFASGAVSGFTATLLTQPMDVIKTRRQAALLGIETGTRSTTLFAIGRDIIRRQGIRGLYSGLPARVTRVTMSCAVMVSGYEVGKHVLTMLANKNKSE